MSVLSVSAQERQRTGTAFAVTTDGHMITSAHLLKSAKSVQVYSAQSGQSFTAEVIAVDDDSDLALLRTDLKTQPLPIVDFSGVPNGLEIFALGFPLPSYQGRELKVTSGIINARTGLRGAPGSFQFSAPIQSGNSGGPVIAADGSMVGVIHGKLVAKPRDVQRNSESPQNVSFATDSNAVADFLASQGIHVIRQTIKLSKVLRPHEVFERVQPSVFFVEIKYAAPKLDVQDISLALRRVLAGISREDQGRLLGVYAAGFTEVLRSKKETIVLRKSLPNSPDSKPELEARYKGAIEGAHFQMIVSFDESKKYKDQFGYQSVILEMVYDCKKNASATLYREYKELPFAGGVTRLKLIRKSTDEWDASVLKAVKSEALKKFFQSNLCSS